MLVHLILGLLAFQEPPPVPPGAGEGDKPKVEAQEPKKVVETWDDRRGKDEAKKLKAAFKGKASMRERNQALDAVAKGANKNLVKPLQSIVEKDKSIVIRRRAAQLLGNQPPKETTKVLLKLLANAKVKAAPPVQGELIKSLSRCGYESKMWKAIGREFDRVYHLDRVPVQEAMLELVIAHKEKAAIRTLLNNIDEPLATNVDDAGNPPAEYWEARWKSWRIWRGKVKDALFAITGQRFSTSDEARTWLRKNKHKLK